MNTEANNMEKTKGKQYAEAIVNGVIPYQESYNFQEVYELVNLTTSWAAEQIDYAKGELTIDDPADYVDLIKVRTPQEAVKEHNSFVEEILDGTTEFVREYFINSLEARKKHH